MVKVSQSVTVSVFTRSAITIVGKCLYAHVCWTCA